ncbi:MAG: hypothetical protein WC756_16350 [Taibaiella sp.]|jgi:hypothetical protein
MGFKDIFKSKELVNLTQPIIELGIDSISKDGFVRDIPVIDIIAKGYDVVIKIRRGMYVRKVGEFFTELKDIPLEDREKFIKKIDKSYKRFFEALQVQIDRIVDEEKAKLIGRLFKAAILEEITIEDFKRYSYMIESVFLYDFTILETTHFALIGRAKKEYLYKQGFADQKIKDSDVQMFAHGSKSKAQRPEYVLNDTGKKIIDICYPDKER